MPVTQGTSTAPCEGQGRWGLKPVEEEAPLLVFHFSAEACRGEGERGGEEPPSASLGCWERASSLKHPTGLPKATGGPWAKQGLWDAILCMRCACACTRVQACVHTAALQGMSQEDTAHEQGWWTVAHRRTLKELERPRGGTAVA